MPILRSVRSYRKYYSLTQGDLAHLLALSQTRVSRLESNDEPATIETAFALQVIFGIQPSQVFPRLYESVEETVMARATGLDRKLRRRSSGAAVGKRKLLSDMVARVRPAPQIS